MTTTERTLVFAGPTLSGLGDWRRAREDRFVFHPPVRCGNVLEAFREGYRTILIIDGFFERCPAVWHKEIMFFIERGGTLVGCSSMGALRAVELEPYGMLGYGKVVDDFKAGRIADDDEVTVAHLGPAQDFVSLTDAMVNIRYTVADAITKGALESADAAKIIDRAKDAFYKKRKLDLFAKEVLSGDKHDRFVAYLTQHGMIDQKRNDALDLFEHLDAWLPGAKERSKKSPDPISYTVLVQNLQYLVDVNPPALEKEALSEDSRLVKMGHLLVGKQYHLLSMLAGAIMHYSNAIKDRKVGAYTPVSWLDQAWFEGDDKITRLVAGALEDCPEYRTSEVIPRGVRYLALQLEFPLELFDMSLPTSDALTTNSVSNYSRLLYLLGMFVDGRMRHDPLGKRLVATDRAIELRMAQYTIRGHSTPEEQREFLSTWGLDDLRDAALHLERNAMLLSEVNTGVSFWFFETGVYWYDMALRATGFRTQLRSLTRPEVREAFCQELAEDLAGMSPNKRLNEMLMAGLPPDLLEAAAINKYIVDELGV
jgi:hypothetical protein